MRMKLVCLMVVLSALSISGVNAQCNRGGTRGSGSMATGSTTPVISSTALSSPMVLSPLSTSPTAAILAAQYPSRLARQQYLALQQQRLLQERLQQRRDQEQLSALRSAEDGTSRQEASYADGRRQQARQRNAERAFELAEKARTNGRLSTARKQYRRVLRILGDNDTLGRFASDALTELAHSGSESVSGEELVAFRTR